MAYGLWLLFMNLSLDVDMLTLLHPCENCKNTVSMNNEHDTI